MKSRLLTAIGITLAAHASLGAEVTGTVTLPNGKPAVNAVVWITNSTQVAPLRPAVVDQRDVMFSPHVSVITVGTRVDFPNNDTVFHNVFAEFDAKKFDLGMYARGRTKSVTFDKPGLVAILCSIHSTMSAFIMVVDTPYYAITDSHGRFHIKNIGPGDATVDVWHEPNFKLHEKLVIHEGSQDLQLKVSRR